VSITRVAVLISGSGTNLQAIIDAQLDINIVGVVSDRPEAFGLERATGAGIHSAAINYKSFSNAADYNAALATALDALNPDLVVLAGYMRILPDNIVNAYAGRMLNVHPSLLPAYPGLDTYNRALAAGESHHGSTVHFVIPELDAGPPILQYRVQIRPAETEPELRERVQQGEYIIYPRTIEWFAARRLQLDNNQVRLDGTALSEPVIVDAEAC
jgi:phosphoribosylglycinamide formyltransferase-1